jgi:hypothetical protein
MTATGEPEGIIGVVAMTTPVKRHESYFLGLGRVSLVRQVRMRSIVCVVERGRFTMAQLYSPDGIVVNRGTLPL